MNENLEAMHFARHVICATAIYVKIYEDLRIRLAPQQFISGVVCRMYVCYQQFKYDKHHYSLNFVHKIMF